MSDLETSFTVEVLGFPEDSDLDAVAEGISSFFGISKDEARSLVDRAPIRVKRRADGAVTKELVKQLRALGANVLVRNEQTGDERTYLVTDSRRSAPIVTEAPAHDETLDSDEGEPPPEQPPRVEVIPPPAPTLGMEGNELGDVPPTSQAHESQEAAVSSDRESDSRRTPSGPSTQTAFTLSTPPSSTPGLAPPSAPILSLPPPSAAKLEFCGACKSPIDKGEICGRCGWNTTTKERHCRQCRRKLTIGSLMSSKPAVGTAAVFVAVILGAGLFVLLGAGAGGAGLALGGALAFTIDAFTLKYSCKVCTIAVVTERLQKQEILRLGTARKKSLLVSALSLLVAVGFFFVVGLSKTFLTDSSYDIAWTMPVPRMNSKLGKELVSLRMPNGIKRVRVHFAERAIVPGSTYFLTHVQYTHPSKPSQVSKEGLEISIKQLVEVLFVGTLSEPLSSSGEVLQGSFTGTFHGKAIFGSIRGEQNGHDMMLTVVTAGAKADVMDPSAQEVLRSVVASRNPQ